MFRVSSSRNSKATIRQAITIFKFSSLFGILKVPITNCLVYCDQKIIYAVRGLSGEGLKGSKKPETS
jgi:hypothetical protein